MLLPLAAVNALETPVWAWGVFGFLVLSMLTLDLLILNRKAHVPSIREAAIWSAVWIGLALAFDVGVYHWKGAPAAKEFLAAYLLEKSLSVDNLFIFLVIFRYFRVPTVFQHRVLFWGILGALFLRAVMIGVGVQAIELFRPILFAFAGLLIYTGIKLFFSDEESHDPSKTWVYRFTKKYIPMTSAFHEDKFFVRQAARWVATPLFLVLLVVETTDLAFALDSIPACLAISQDLFVVYTSNIFAILGLRALFFLLAGMLSALRFLKPALSIVLVYIGLKMVLAELHKHYQIGWAFELPIDVSLGIIGGILGLSIAASLLFPTQPPKQGTPKIEPEESEADHEKQG